jgi:hypothetical protein
VRSCFAVVVLALLDVPQYRRAMSNRTAFHPESRTEMNRCTLALVFVASTALASPAARAATTFMDINFSGDTPGSSPAVSAAPANPITLPRAIGGYTLTSPPEGDTPPTAASGTIVVDNAGGMSNGAHLTTNPANQELGALWLDTGFSQTSQLVTLSFDVNILSAPTVAVTQPKLLDGGPGLAGILLGMNTFGTAQGTRFAAAPTSATGGVFAIRTPDNTGLQSFFSYTEGQTYHIDLVSNYDTGLVGTYVDGVFTGNQAFATGAAANVTTQEFFFHLNGEAGNANSVALDNIVATVPEPTGIALLSLGAGAMLLRRRQRRRA